MGSRAPSLGAPFVLTIVLLALAGPWAVVLPAAAQQPGSVGDPAFVGDAATQADLAAAGFLPEESQALGVGGDAAGAPPAFGLVTGSPAAELTRLEHPGTAISAYSDTPLESAGGISLACGFAYLSEPFRTNYIGVGSTYFAQGAGCGRCLKVQCDDTACQPPGASIVAQVVDLCGDCTGGDIALSLPAIYNLTGGVPPTSVLQVSWDVVDCAPYIDGTIKMYIKPGGSVYYQSFGFSNSLEPIVAVMVNGDRLKPSTSSAYWDWNPGKQINPQGPFVIALAGSSRQVLRVRIGQLRSQDLRVQFTPLTPLPTPEASAAATSAVPAPETAPKTPVAVVAPPPAPAQAPAPAPEAEAVPLAAAPPVAPKPAPAATSTAPQQAPAPAPSGAKPAAPPSSPTGPAKQAPAASNSTQTPTVAAQSAPKP